MGIAWSGLWLLCSWASPQVEAGWWVDASTAARPGAWGVRQALPCDAEDGVLGVSLVVYSRKELLMAWGHASIRTVGCDGGKPFDREYETYVVSKGNWPEIERVLEGNPVLEDEDYWRRQKGRLFAFRNDDPVDAGFFAESHAKNREIYELWLDLPPERMQEVSDALEATLAEQQERVDARRNLDGQYKALDTNCTVAMQRLFARPWHLPFRWLRELEDEARLRVLHPSRHVLRRWGEEIPQRVMRRPRPVFRRSVEAWPEVEGGPLLPSFVPDSTGGRATAGR